MALERVAEHSLLDLASADLSGGSSRYCTRLLRAGRHPDRARAEGEGGDMSDERICPTCGTEGVIVAFISFGSDTIRSMCEYECCGPERHRWRSEGLFDGSTRNTPIDDDDGWDLA